MKYSFEVLETLQVIHILEDIIQVAIICVCSVDY